MTPAPLRFCMVTTFYPPYHFGGDAVAVQRLSRALVRAGHEVTVVHDVDAFRVLAGDEASAIPPTPVDDGVQVVRLQSRMATLSTLLTQQLGRPVVHGSQLRQLLSRGRFDVVNFHNVSLVGGPGVLAMGGDALRVYMAHEHWLVCPTHVLWRFQREVCDAPRCVRCQLSYRRPPQLWRMTGTLRRALRHVDAFIAMSEFSRAKHREFGFPHEMEVLPSFLPETVQTGEHAGTSPHPRPFFLFAGRLERIKGVESLLEASAGYPDADILILGRGDHEGHLRAAASGNPRVRFLGYIASDAVRDYYRHALALVMPSVCFETFGLGLIEAFREGTPVIARRLGPFPEIVEQSRAGLLFTTPDELREAMRRIQHEPGLHTRLSAEARTSFLREWTEQVVIPRYLSIIDRASERSGTPKAHDARPRGAA